MKDSLAQPPILDDMVDDFVYIIIMTYLVYVIHISPRANNLWSGGSVANVLFIRRVKGEWNS